MIGSNACKWVNSVALYDSSKPSTLVDSSRSSALLTQHNSSHGWPQHDRGCRIPAKSHHAGNGVSRFHKRLGTPSAATLLPAVGYLTRLFHSSYSTQSFSLQPCRETSSTTLI